MGTIKKQEDSEFVYSVIQKSFTIQSHLDFFIWLRDDVGALLSHQVLISAWGDFSKGSIHFDVSSNLPDISTQHLLEHPTTMVAFMSKLFQQWLDNDEKWYVINQFDASEIYSLSSNSFAAQLMHLNSILVYGVRDTRSKADCIYVFFDKPTQFNVRQNLLGLIMPYLDAALRRIECLEPVKIQQDGLIDWNSMGLSKREMEILHWVRSGKTNVEIGMILQISANTVKNHLSRIFQKLDVSSRAQAVAMSIQTMTPDRLRPH